MKKDTKSRSALTTLLILALLAWQALAMSSSLAAKPFWKSIFGREETTSRHVDEFSEDYSPGTIVVSFGDRRLYYVKAGGTAISYPIGVPVADELWAGTEPVSAKRVDPPWRPTAEMRRENPDLPTFVPGGHPRNPLGVRALYLGDTLYRIHGTDAPWTIGKIVSSGCIRLYNEDVIDLYDRVPIGTRVIITSKRFVRHHG